MEICPKCGLPKEACICDVLAKEQQRITIIKEKRKFGKITTIISGFTNDIQVKDIAKKLKRKLACGGTVKGRNIELQGNHVDKAKKKLIELGFPSDNIQVL
jgi:translation initiation factor 1